MNRSIYECHIIQLLLLEEAAIVCQKKWQICIDTVKGPCHITSVSEHVTFKERRNKAEATRISKDDIGVTVRE